MRKYLIFIALVSISAGFLRAQDGKMDYHASFRSRLEMWNWYQGDANNSYAFLGNYYTFSFGQKRETVDWTIELAVPFLLGLPNDAAAPPPQGGLGLGANYFGANKRKRNTIMLFPKQAFLNIHGVGAKPAHALKLGRFNFAEGMEGGGKSPVIAALKRTRIQQRLIGSFGWSHVGRSYNGFNYAWAPGGVFVSLVGGIPSRGVFQVDGWGFVKAGFVYAAVTKPYASGKHSGEVRGFGIYYQDWRRIGKTDNRPGSIREADRANVRIYTFGGHFLHATATGAGIFDFLAWGAGQTGDWGAQDHSAGAVAVEAGFQPKGLDALKPWIRGGYFTSTGDSDPNDGKHQTFFQILPTPRIYARFPFFNLMNLEDVFGEIVWRPHTKLTVRTDIHGLRLRERNDLWYAGGGVFNPWVFGYAGRPSLGQRGLATMYDVSVDIAATAHLTLSGYYAYANGKSVMKAIYPSGKNAHFGYLELSYKF